MTGGNLKRSGAARAPPSRPVPSCPGRCVFEPSDPSMQSATPSSDRRALRGHGSVRLRSARTMRRLVAALLLTPLRRAARSSSLGRGRVCAPRGCPDRASFMPRITERAPGSPSQPDAPPAVSARIMSRAAVFTVKSPSCATASVGSAVSTAGRASRWSTRWRSSRRSRSTPPDEASPTRRSRPQRRRRQYPHRLPPRARRPASATRGSGRGSRAFLFRVGRHSCAATRVAWVASFARRRGGDRAGA